MTADDVATRIMRARDALAAGDVRDVRILIELTPQEYIGFLVSMNPMDFVGVASRQRTDEVEFYGAVVRAVNK